MPIWFTSWGNVGKADGVCVIDEYNSAKSKGWGALAKSLGIKPGSKEFHALKRGDDIYGNDGKGKGSKKGEGKSKSKGKSI